MADILQCDNVSKDYSNIIALDSVSFSLNQGEILSVFGPSGCGKTTLLRLIAGLETVDKGQIFLNERCLSSKKIHILPEKRNIGMVFQDYSLFPHLNVAANIMFGLQNFNKNEKTMRLKEVLDLVKLSGFEDRYPHQLSGGQQQRIALARALAPNPAIILFDEPFSNLDALTRSDILTDLQKIIRENSISTILVTHDREEAFSVSHRVAIMINGKITQIDNPLTVYNVPSDIEIAKLVVNCQFLDGIVKNDYVHTLIGDFVCNFLIKDISENEKVQILIRPENFQISYDPNGKFKIIAHEFLGTHAMITIQSIETGIVIRVREKQEANFNLHDKVNLMQINNRPFIAYPKIDSKDGFREQNV